MNWLDLTAVVFCASVAWHLGFLRLNPARRRTKQEAEQTQAMLASLAAELERQKTQHSESFAACDKAFQAMQAQVFEQVNVLRAKVNAEAMNGERVPNTMGQPGRRIF